MMNVFGEEKNPSRVGIVLSGGGSLGAYEVGVLKALASGRAPGTGYRPLEPVLLSGTSAGAFNAAFLVAQGDVPFATAVSRLEELWLQRISDRGSGNGVFRYRFDPRQLANPTAVARNPFQTANRLIEDSTAVLGLLLQQTKELWPRPDSSLLERCTRILDLNAIISTAPLLRTVRKYIDSRKIRSSPRKIVIAATDWDTAEVYTFTNHDFTEELGPRLLQASAGIPGVFSPVRFGTQTLVDGGVSVNTPIGPAINAGADFLHIIFPYHDLRKGGRLGEGTFAALYRLLLLSWSQLLYANTRDFEFLNRFLDCRKNYQQEKAKEFSAEELALLDDFLSWSQSYLATPAQGKIGAHLYPPGRPLQGGLFNLLDFQYRWIKHLIGRGFHDTIERHRLTPLQFSSEAFTGSLFQPLR